MQIPKEIAEKVEKYDRAKKEADKLYEEIEKWFNENTDTDGIWFGSFCIVDKPKEIIREMTNIAININTVKIHLVALIITK